MLRDEIVGVDELVPVLDGGLVQYVNLDNAATTPPMRAVVDAVQHFLPMAASVHRGSGYKSRFSTTVFEDARRAVGDLVGADPDRDAVVFTKNTTEAINRFARTMIMARDSVVLTTTLEHHSNLLPWRRRGQVVHVRAEADGSVDENDLDTKLNRYAGRVAVLAVTGASNVTGITPPIHRMAAKVHAVGGRILVDAAQLAGHRRIDMRRHDDAEHLDAVAMSAHKVYAPYGSGALVTGRQCIGADPDECGGGTVRAVTLDGVVWADLPDRAEAGSPNLLGAVAFAAAARRLTEVGLDALAAHERDLTLYARRRLATVDGVSIFGPATPDLGVIPFTVDGWDHRLVADVLGHEHGIGVRSGCFCAQPYVHHLLGMNRGEVARWVADASVGDLRRAPGLVRLSIGGYNARSDVDHAVDALQHIVANEVRGVYCQGPDGTYRPVSCRAERQRVR
jgi:selenocysteine lyase/cysteine desulfurase